MHPLKDQREGVKYGRGVKYGVTPATTGVLKFVGVPLLKLIHEFSPNFQDRFTPSGSRAD